MPSFHGVCMQAMDAPTAVAAVGHTLALPPKSFTQAQYTRMLDALVGHAAGVQTVEEAAQLARAWSGLLAEIHERARAASAPGQQLPSSLHRAAAQVLGRVTEVAARAASAGAHAPPKPPGKESPALSQTQAAQARNLASVLSFAQGLTVARRELSSGPAAAETLASVDQQQLLRVWQGLAAYLVPGPAVNPAPGSGAPAVGLNLQAWEALVDGHLEPEGLLGYNTTDQQPVPATARGAAQLLCMLPGAPVKSPAMKGLLRELLGPALHLLQPLCAACEAAAASESSQAVGLIEHGAEVLAALDQLEFQLSACHSSSHSSTSSSSSHALPTLPTSAHASSGVDGGMEVQARSAAPPAPLGATTVEEWTGSDWVGIYSAGLQPGSTAAPTKAEATPALVKLVSTGGEAQQLLQDSVHSLTDSLAASQWMSKVGRAPCSNIMPTCLKFVPLQFRHFVPRLHIQARAHLPPFSVHPQAPAHRALPMLPGLCRLAGIAPSVQDHALPDLLKAASGRFEQIEPKEAAAVAERVAEVRGAYGVGDEQQSCGLHPGLHAQLCTPAPAGCKCPPQARCMPAAGRCSSPHRYRHAGAPCSCKPQHQRCFWWRPAHLHHTPWAGQQYWQCQHHIAHPSQAANSPSTQGTADAAGPGVPGPAPHAGPTHAGPGRPQQLRPWAGTPSLSIPLAEQLPGI